MRCQGRGCGDKIRVLLEEVLVKVINLLSNYVLKNSNYPYYPLSGTIYRNNTNLEYWLSEAHVLFGYRGRFRCTSVVLTLSTRLCSNIFLFVPRIVPLSALAVISNALTICAYRLGQNALVIVRSAICLEIDWYCHWHLYVLHH